MQFTLQEPAKQALGRHKESRTQVPHSVHEQLGGRQTTPGSALELSSEQGWGRGMVDRQVSQKTVAATATQAHGGVRMTKAWPDNLESQVQT